MGETFGVGLFITGMVLFVGAAYVAMTGQIDDLFIWALGWELIKSILMWGSLGAVVIVAVVVMMSRSGRSPIAHIHGGRRKTVIKHEAGHAAVAHGVGAGNVRARLKPGGGGEVTCDVNRMSPAEYIAYCRAGRAVAGGSGDCQHDISQEKQELDCLPEDQRARISREADAIVRRHVNSSFGHRVAQALERDGYF